ncbi:3,4-dihydroxy-2-butanone 4-phosphate synthase [Sparassis crispa]|uniref:3,4-dihydroxy-2-butanone 4-phosphate synthase n=1 Tax=Sparassis crispa TaxID=139825 RepID=A0A401GVB5_9APHY|nr:3,4-dihydroxy-2-butanone 4-phosphate synthase [Sparassis crispa]GBE86129.1 3,4-dihydroxy-2-butanone 4-phosphate synthase [Sparassis crispa]
MAENFETRTPPAASNPSRPREVHDAHVRTAFGFDSMEDALAAFVRGEFLVVMDDEGRENEGDLILAASECSTEKMAWLIRHSSGYVCIALPGERLDELEIPMMVSENQDPHRTAYTVTVDYRHGTTTGISAHDRALTARALASPTSQPSSFTRPGHMVPLRARPGGVLARRGHTESALDLCELVGLPRAGILCELVEDDETGSMMRRDSCRRFADRWGLKLISVEMLARWKREHASKGRLPEVNGHPYDGDASAERTGASDS